MIRRALLLVLILIAVACARSEPPRPLPAANAAPAFVPSIARPEPVTSVAAPSPSPSPAPSPTAPPCSPPLALRPRVLAARWPALLGQRVRLRVRVVRALSPAEFLVVADGERFLVLAPPDTEWAGDRVFTVIGSGTASLGGRVRLPELTLDDHVCG